MLRATVAWLLTTTLVLGQGSLTPPAPPGPTMKTLDQIEARTPISSAPYTINTPGSYYLTRNISVAAGTAITIAANGVTLDLNGFTIVSTASPADGTAISADGKFVDITITNGHIRGSVSDDGNGNFSGAGFYDGVRVDGSNGRAIGLTVSGVQGVGVDLSPTRAVVESCTVTNAGGLAIGARVVTRCVVDDSYFGIRAQSCSDCSVDTIDNAISALGGTVSNCQARSAQGYGIDADEGQVMNSSGYALGYGVGVRASSASNSHGYSNHSTGMYAATAMNCVGESTSYTGLFASVAMNCFGSSGTGVGLTFDKLGSSCYGRNNSAYDYVVGSGLAGPVNLPK